jgi:hypothetical protein
MPRASTKCHLCGGLADRNAVGLNKKLLGEKVSKFFCISCLAEHLGVEVEDLFAKIEEFKAQGCKLFG